MLPPTRFLPVLLAAALSVGAIADTITLKTGEKVEGKITAETDQEITIDIKVSAGVTDELKIPMTKVEKVEKLQPEDLAWLPLKDLKPGVNSLPLAQYETVTGPLQAFLNEFPKSAHAAEASQMITILIGEKQRVAAGEVRLGDKWLSKEEADKERLQIGGLLVLQHMRSQRAAGDLIGALNSFDQLEKSFPGAKTYPDAVEIAGETLATLKATVARMQQTFKDQAAVFAAGIATSSEKQKPELLAARQRELALGEAALAAADKAKIKWPALAPHSDKNLDAIAKKVQPELQRVAAIDIAKLRQSVRLAEQGRKELAEQNTGAQESLKRALDLWPANELAKRLQTEGLTTRIATQKNASASSTESRPATESVPAAATPAPAATPQPAAATPRSETKSASQASPSPATPRPRASTPVAAPETEPEPPFFMTIGGIITIVVLLAVLFGGWAAFNKVRHRANDVLE